MGNRVIIPAVVDRGISRDSRPRDILIDVDRISACLPWDVNIDGYKNEMLNGYLLLVNGYVSHGKQNIERYWIEDSSFCKIVEAL